MSLHPTARLPALWVPHWGALTPLYSVLCDAPMWVKGQCVLVEYGLPDL